jgi:hypothetical protein
VNELIQIPTIEQINLEHRLANSKAAEAVQHAANCGLMLLQVKASLKHGEWLPWLKQQQDAGAIGFSHMTATKYMRLASNINRDLYLEESTSIRAALELLSDKPEGPQQEALLDVEAEREAREKAEQEAKAEREARGIAERRAEEFRQESNERRKKIRELESQTGERIIEKEVIPPDYEAAKQKAAALEGELKALKADQQKIVDSQVQAKLRGYQSELDELERKKAQLDDMVARKQAYMESLSSDVKRIETHRSVIDGIRLELIGLAAFLSDMEDMRDLDTIRRWQALSGMLQEAKAGIDALFPAKPRLEVINHV